MQRDVRAVLCFHPRSSGVESTDAPPKPLTWQTSLVALLLPPPSSRLLPPTSCLPPTLPSLHSFLSLHVCLLRPPSFSPFFPFSFPPPLCFPPLLLTTSLTPLSPPLHPPFPTSFPSRLSLPCGPTPLPPLLLVLPLPPSLPSVPSSLPPLKLPLYFHHLLFIPLPPPFLHLPRLQSPLAPTKPPFPPSPPLLLLHLHPLLAVVLLLTLSALAWPQFDIFLFQTDEGTELETAAVCDDLVPVPVFLVSCYDGAASSMPSFLRVCVRVRTITLSVLEAVAIEARFTELAAAHSPP